MGMGIREKLILLIRHEVVQYFAERIADHLIANGVTIPVMCKDCIYYHKKLGIGFGQCSKCTLMPYPEDFCSYGERKKE